MDLKLAPVMLFEMHDLQNGNSLKLGLDGRFKYAGHCAIPFVIRYATSKNRWPRLDPHG